MKYVSFVFHDSMSWDDIELMIIGISQKPFYKNSIEIHKENI